MTKVPDEDVEAREGAWAELGETRMAHEEIESRLRFIRDAAEGRISIFKLTRDELSKSFARAGYPPSHAEGGYQYLLDTDISSMTVEGVQQLERERDETLAQKNAAKASAALFARQQIKVDCCISAAVGYCFRQGNETPVMERCCTVKYCDP